LPNQHDKLVRTIGRWSLAALMLNTMIGASIFGLPSLIAARLGRLSPIAYLAAFAGVALIAACLAEVASRFHQAGGPYLYAREAFGRFVGIEIGWLTWLSRIAACSGVANLFITYLGEFFPAVRDAKVRAAVLITLIVLLAIVNYRGVRDGKWLSNFFTASKIVLLVVFAAGGLIALQIHPSMRMTPASVHARPSDWFAAILLMVYAYGGFESALIASGEASNPRKDAPMALAIALATATVLYVSVQYVVIYTLADPGATSKPAVDSARQFLGPSGVFLVAIGTLISVYGYLSANMLHTPRVTFAMAERGDFPSIFGAVHPRFRTPHISIVAFALLLSAFSIYGDFRWNATLSAVARLFMYASVVAALPVLRRRDPQGAAFHLPAGNLLAMLALGFTALLLVSVRWRDVIVVLVTMAIAALNWVWARRSGQKVRTESQVT
jgi:basic amino acid/polyamine antiporter, APA family